MWGGRLFAVEVTVAAGLLIIFTLVLRFPSIMPLNGWGSGVGIANGGSNTICISTATILSPCLAAGFPMIIVNC